MNPRHGEVWLVDMGMASKTRPAVILMAENLNAPRSLIIYIPITKQNRGSDLEVALGHLPFLDKESVANAQGVKELHCRDGGVGRKASRFSKCFTRFRKFAFLPPEVPRDTLFRIVIRECA